jgi:peptidoglycan/LPS O-acetylase OafA/YrhL
MTSIDNASTLQGQASARPNRVWWIRIIPLIIAILVFGIIYIVVDYLVISSFARIVVEMEGPDSSKARAYFSTSAHHEAFSEEHSSAATPYVGGKRVTLVLNLEGNSTIKKLRLDPGEAPGVYKIYAISLLSYFGPPVKLVPFEPTLGVKGGPDTALVKKAQYLEVTGQNDDPYCIFERPLAVYNPYFQFGAPLIFAIIAFTIAGKARPSEFKFWKDVREKKSSTGANYQALDGLRGLAAFSVILDHSGVPGCDGIGMVGVVIFFSLSGFLLTIPFAKNGARILSLAYVQNYFLRRVCRIAPMFYAVILAVYFFNNRIEDAIRSALFLQGNSIYWTVLQEMHFYLLLPAVMLVNHLLFRDIKWLIVLFLLVVSYRFNHNLLVTYSVYGIGKSMTLYAGLFFSGMMTCYLFHIEVVRDSKLLKQLCGNHLLTLALFTVVILFLQLWPFTHEGEKLNGAALLVGNYSYLVVTLLFVVAMSESSCVAKFLRLLPLRLLGLVSYSFYLLHPIFIKAARHLSNDYLQGRLGNIGVCAVALVVAFLVGTVTYTFIERPFISKDG